MLMPLVLTNRRRRGGSASAPAFSPSTLFSTTAIGIWLDPSDLSTMFSDRAGTTAVTTPGTVVGLRLDKSKGLVLGTELVTNGDGSNTSGWLIFGSAGASSLTSSSNQFVFTSDATVAYAYQSLTTVAEKYYEISFDVVARTAGVYFRVGTSSGGGTLYTANNASLSGPQTFIVKATTTTTFVQFGMGAGQTLTFDNISVRGLAGNHAVAPTDAARPIYGVEPKGGRRNLLLATDTLATQSLTVTAVAHTLAFTGTGTVTLTGASTAGPLVGTGAGNRVSLTFTPSAASLTLTVSGSVTLGQLELGSTATPYQRVLSAYDVTESGVATTHYVQYDGSDDSMSTAAIDFTATDKMSVFAGVRKLSDAAIGQLVELSAAASVNAGSFYITAPETTADNYGLRGGGSSRPASTVVSGYASPISNVVSSLIDIPGDTLTVRINGTQVAQNINNQGTGTFGNYPLFIGRRNNSNLPFNGRDYGIVIVGKAASGTEITDTELWLSDKTSEVDVAKSISPNIYTRSGDTILDRANSIIERRTV